jgi:hypothetical protein
MKHMENKSGCGFKSRAAGQRGSTLVLVTVFIVALFAFAALSIDVGNVLVERNRLQEAGDAAALAAVVDWATNAAASVVVQRAKDFDRANGVKTNEASVRVGTWDNANKTFIARDPLDSTDTPAVEVVNRRAVPLRFAGVVGMSGMSPRTVSVAIASEAGCIKGVLPLAVCVDTNVVAQCDTMTLHFTNLDPGTNSCSAGASAPNFGALDLSPEPGGGTAQFRDYVINGYTGTVCVGDCVNLKTGNLGANPANAVQQRVAGLPPYNCTVNPASAAPDNKRTAVIPKVASLNGTGCVKVEGFYVVVLDDPEDKGGQRVVEAKFVKILGGTKVNPDNPCNAGDVCGIALVK